MRLFVSGARRGRGLGGLTRRAAVGAFLGLGWVIAGVLAVVLVVGGGDDSRKQTARAGKPPSAQGSGRGAPDPPALGDTQVVETEGQLAVGLTEPNPAFLWPRAAKAVGAPFDRWRDQVERIRPAYYRLVVDWAALQPDAAQPANLDRPEGGCMRDVAPCSPWAGVRDQLRAIAARQRVSPMQVLVVITGTPAWAARPASGCERAGIEPRSRAPRTDALPAYANLVADLIAAGTAEGAQLRYFSAFNEPNHPYFISPQRERCSGSAASASVAPYVALARAMKRALDAAPGEQEYVLGELAGLLRRTPRSTSVGELARALPDALVCGAKAWSQHGYVGGPDPVDSATAALRTHGCRRSPEIWITETGVGAPERGSSRATSAKAGRGACAAMDARMRRWYADPRVTVAFQYTVREDDKFPTGLVDVGLGKAYPVMQAWQAWGGQRRPEAPPPKDACG